MPAQKPMNLIQKLMTAFMLLVMLGLLLFPQWVAQWTIRYDARYCYDADLRGRTPEECVRAAPNAFTTTSEYESHRGAQRAFLFTGPPRPALLTPPSRTEETGTGSVRLGLRHTVYTGVALTEFQARVNAPKLLWELMVMLIPLALLVIMFRDRGTPSRIQFIRPEDEHAAGEAPRIRLPRPPGGQDRPPA
jgi:hypothetical protein